MFTLRCTAKLLKLLATAPETADLKTTHLGDWYANIVWASPRTILCVSERTLLPVLIPGRDPQKTLLPELRRGLGQVLQAIGIPAKDIAEEERAMEIAAVSRTANRRVLGSMNDFAFMLDFHRREGGSLLEMALQLSKAPCSPLGRNNPRQATEELFGKPKLSVAK